MKKLLDDIDNYFKAQKELYGSDLILDRELAEHLDQQIGISGKHKKSVKKVKNRKAQTPLHEFYYEIKDCKKCELGATRTNFVFGVGNDNAELMLVGEAPGRDEDLQGIPFVGRAGQLLTLMLKSIGLNREEVFIANVLKCRPPNNRDPLPDEIEKCEPYLLKQIDIISPKIIVTLGRFAAATLLKTRSALGSLRGEIHSYNNRPLIVTYHPAALLRNPTLKRQAWEDLKTIRSYIKKGDL
jgi:DNA polymerase